jgi:hypothetical protein
MLDGGDEPRAVGNLDLLRTTPVSGWLAVMRWEWAEVTKATVGWLAVCEREGGTYGESAGQILHRRGRRNRI